MKSRPPLHGYNTNYRREGKVYHVQTEDLGHPLSAVVTQVFTGGTILANKRTPYIEIIDDDHADDHVRELMRRQHKSMLVALRDGSLGLDQAGPAPASSSVEIAAETSAERADDTVEEPPPVEEGTFDILDEVVNLRDTVRMDRPPHFAEALLAEARRREAARAEAEAAERSKPEDRKKAERAPKGPPSAPPKAPPKARPKTRPKTEREAERPPEAPAPEASEVSLPATLPPPKIVERSAQPAPLPRVEPKRTMPLFAAARAEDRQPTSQQPRPPAASRLSEVARESSTPPAAKKPRPSQAPRIFSEVSESKRGLGEDQLGERSLDEVILSYLADDLQED
jgi:hypothetical protein